MAAINEDLIQKVFDKMIKYRPALLSCLLRSDTDEEADYRIKGDLVIKNFPWPIGVELRRLFSASMRHPGRLRLDQIFKTIERTAQFISFVMVCQLWIDVANNKIVIPKPVREEFARRFCVLTLGNFCWLIRTLAKLYSAEKAGWFIAEMNDQLNEEFLSLLDFWIPERNEIGHYQINLNEEEIERRCVEYEDKLSLILQRLAFITGYSLVSVREIKVLKPRIHEAKFHHIIDLLNSTDSDFREKEIDEERYSDSNSVLLMKSIKSFNDYLSLSPLIIDTHSETIDTKEKFEIRKDIFMFSKYKDNHLMYIGTEVTDKCDLRSLSNYDILLEEYRELMLKISGVIV
ncbi:MAG: hypothetical protein IQL11_11785 [Bacteroidales bacterium]|nr:hypothetical protein [Bacteroidales bacterium]